MAKSITVQRKVFKIESQDIRHFTEVILREKNKNLEENQEKFTIKNSMWEYEIDKKYEIKNNTNRVISLGESNTLRMLDLLRNRNQNIKEEYDDIIKAKKLKSKNIKLPNKLEKYVNKSISDLNEMLLNMQFQEDYLMITFNKKSDYRYIHRNGLKINGKTFKRLYGTAGSLKNNTVIFICDDKIKKSDKQTIRDSIVEILEAEHDKTVPLIPSKYGAYLSLNSSASTPVLPNFSVESILVVKDQSTKFKGRTTLIHECNGDNPNIETVDDYEFELEQTDGSGICDIETAREITKCLNPHLKEVKDEQIGSCFIIRHNFTKGTLNPMDIQEFKRVYGKKDFVKDTWGNDIDFSKVKMIIPTSMLKLWKTYKSREDWYEKSVKYGHTFAVTKMLYSSDNERTMNYQFLASLNLNSEQIRKLVQPTINEFHAILGGDYRKSILYARGKDVNEANVDFMDGDFLKALMIDYRLIDDIHVRKHIHKMLKTAINRAKIGKIKVKGTYNVISPDVFGFMQHVFGLENQDGLLKKGEFYSAHWNKLGVKKVSAMRAPACCHANFRVLNLVQNNEMNKWYKFMPHCMIFNGHDSTCESLSGAD